MPRLVFVRRARENAGFTLLELIVVITIIGILSTIVLVNMRYAPAKARRLQVDADVKSMLNVASVIYVETGLYPESIDEMIGASDRSGNAVSASLDKLPRDPWGNDYGYSLVDGLPEIVCLGADGAEGGDGRDSVFRHRGGQRAWLNRRNETLASPVDSCYEVVEKLTARRMKGDGAWRNST